MEAKELRIGNWINSWRISDEWHHTQISSGKELDFIFMQEENNIYKPIPLTEEWLLKFGFVKLGDGFEFWESSVFNIEFIRNHWHVCYTSNVLCTHLKYVHQLQNLYFALTGEELKIENKTL